MPLFKAVVERRGFYRKDGIFEATRVWDVDERHGYGSWVVAVPISSTETTTIVETDEAFRNAFAPVDEAARKTWTDPPPRLLEAMERSAKT